MNKVFAAITVFAFCIFSLSAYAEAKKVSDMSEDEITAALNTQRDDKDALYLYRALLYAKEGNFEAAYADIASSFILNPSNGYAYSTAAYIYLLAGDHRKVVECAEKEIELLPNVPEGYGYKGMSLLFLIADSQGSVKEKALQSIQAFSRAMELDSDSTRGYYWRGRAEILMGGEEYLDLALADFRKDIQYNPQSYKGYYNAAAILVHKEKYKEAVKMLSQSLAIKPDFLDALYLRADCGLFVGTAAEVEKDCATYISLAKTGKYTRLGTNQPALCPSETYELAMIHTIRAVVYRMEHKFEESIADLSEAIRLQPEIGTLYGVRRSVYESAADQTKKASLKRKYLKLARRDDQMAKRLNAGKAKSEESILQGIKIGENLLPTLLETAGKGGMIK